MRIAPLLLALALAVPASGQTRYEWVGTSGVWTDAANWSPTGVPAAADTAVVGGAFGTITTLTANTVVAGLAVEELGAVAGDFDLTVTDRFVWSGGGSSFEAFQGDGAITNASTSTLFMSNPSTRFEMSAGRTLVNDGLIVWEGMGSWRGQGRLVNNGEMILAMGQSDAFGFIASDQEDILTNTASGVIRRNGTGAALLYSGFVNDGLVSVEAGTLQLQGFNSNGARGTGSIEIDAGAELHVSGGVHRQRRVTGASLVLISNPRLEVSDAYDVTTTRITGGFLQLDTDAVTEILQIEAGSVEGSGDLTVTGSLDWTGGVMGGSGTTTLGPAIPFTIGGGNVSLRDTRTLRVQGTTTWTGEANLSGESNTTFENDGTLTSSGAGDRLFFGPTFANTGTLIHDGGTLDFQAPMSNAGTVRIESGTLKQQGLSGSGGIDTGRYIVASGASLLFNGGNRTLTETAEITGTGTVAFNGGTVTNRGLWSPGTSPGILSIDSNWPAPAPESVLELEVGGTTAGTEHDQLAVSGTAALGGTLRVTLTDGFKLAADGRILLIPAASVTGTFDTIELPDGLEAYIAATAAGVELIAGSPVAGEDSPDAPDTLALVAPAPNPAAGTVALAYAVPKAGAVRLAVFDALGREVAVLLDRETPAGSHTFRLDASRLAPGIYVVRLGAGAEMVARTLTVAR